MGCYERIYIESQFADIKKIIGELDVKLLVSYLDTTKELCSDALIQKNMDKAKYYHCLAHLLELNLKSHRISEVV
jgi:hypothetical protein